MTGILQNYLPLVVFIGVASLIGLALPELSDAARADLQAQIKRMP